MRLQYFSTARGWWTGHASFDPPNPQAYLDGLNLRARITDDDDGVLYRQTHELELVLNQMKEDDMARTTSFEGSRYGDWYVGGRGKPIGGKRFWICTNVVTDEVRVVAQTDLKKLDGHDPETEAPIGLPAEQHKAWAEGDWEPGDTWPPGPESDNNEPSDGDDEMPTSAEITARVLAGNYADDPFSVPAEAFEPIFREPPVVVEPELPFEVTENPFGILLDDHFQCETELPGAELVLEGGDALFPADLMPDGLDESRPNADLHVLVNEAQVKLSDLRDTLDQITKMLLTK